VLQETLPFSRVILECINDIVHAQRRWSPTSSHLSVLLRDCTTLRAKKQSERKKKGGGHNRDRTLAHMSHTTIHSPAAGPAPSSKSSTRTYVPTQVCVHACAYSTPKTCTHNTAHLCDQNHKHTAKKGIPDSRRARHSR
jgi:hypothetical protein